VIFEGLNDEYRHHVEIIYPGDMDCLFTKTQDEVWDFFKKLAWDTYKFEQARNIFGYPTHSESVFPFSPCLHDPFIDSDDPSHPYLPSILCNYCESSDRTTCHCPYHAYVDANMCKY